jgi:hypothetical protein
MTVYSIRQGGHALLRAERERENRAAMNGKRGSAKLTLFKALMYVGFESCGPRKICRGNVTISLRIGHRAHWYVSTPLGIRDYQSQRHVLHALALYKLVNKEDLQKMAELGFLIASEELDKLENTEKRSTQMISKQSAPKAAETSSQTKPQ